MFWIIFLLLATMFFTGRLVFLVIRGIYRRRPRDLASLVIEQKSGDEMVIGINHGQLPYLWSYKVIPAMKSDDIVHQGDNLFNLVLVNKKGRQQETAYFSKMDGVLDIRMTSARYGLEIGRIYQIQTSREV